MNKKKILLLNPPYPKIVLRDHYCSSESKGNYLWQPIDLQIQSSWLEYYQYTVYIYDAMITKYNDNYFDNYIKQILPDHVLILVSEHTWKSDKNILQRLRNLGVNSIIGTGDFLKFNTMPINETINIIDWILLDFTSPDLARTLNENKCIGESVVPNDGSNLKKINSKHNLNYPSEINSSFLSNSYRLPYPGFKKLYSILTSYGCPFNCKFCHVSKLDYKNRDPNYVLNDFNYAIKNNAKSIYIRDATLNGKYNELLNLLKLIIKNDKILPWSAFVTVEPFNILMAELLYKSGCRHLQIGIESLEHDIRLNNKKHFKYDSYIEFIDICKHVGIKITGHFVLGLPGESTNNLENTINNINTLNLDYIAINIATDRPGIPWRDNNIKIPNITDYNSSNNQYIFLEKTRNKIYRNFYFNMNKIFVELKCRYQNNDLYSLINLIPIIAKW